VCINPVEKVNEWCGAGKRSRLRKHQIATEMIDDARIIMDTA
jgi:hypothetical protein